MFTRVLEHSLELSLSVRSFQLNASADTCKTPHRVSLMPASHARSDSMLGEDILFSLLVIFDTRMQNILTNHSTVNTLAEGDWFFRSKLMI